MSDESAAGASVSGAGARRRGIDALIATAPVFADLAPVQLERVAGCGRNQRVDAGVLLMQQGQPADRFFLIREGAVALEVSAPARGTVVIATLHAGELLGWSWLFPPYRWRVDGRTIAPTAVIAFDGKCLRDKCEADHDLGYALMKRFAAAAIDRLQDTRLQLLDVYANPRAV